MKRLVVILILMFAFPVAAKAEWLHVPLEDLVRDSNLIVVATLQSVSEHTRDEVDYGEGTLTIHEVLWGGYSPGDEVTLKWRNPSGLLCPRVEHRGNQNEKGIWLLTVAEDGSVAANYPGRFLGLGERPQVESLLARGFFIDGGYFHPTVAFSVTLIFRNATKIEKLFPGIAFNDGQLHLSPHSKLTTSRYAEGGRSRLRPLSGKLVLAKNLNGIKVPAESEVKVEFDLKALYSLSPTPEDVFFVKLNLAGQPAANEARVALTVNEALLSAPALPSKGLQPTRQSVPYNRVFTASPPRNDSSRVALARAMAVFLLALLIYFRLYRN